MLFLTQAEIKELTGYDYVACQIRWLNQQGIKYLVGGDGKPKVLQSHICEVMGLQTKVRRTKEPNFAALGV